MSTDEKKGGASERGDALNDAHSPLEDADAPVTTVTL